GAPPRQCSPPKLCSNDVLLGSWRAGGLGNVVLGFMPFSSAAEAVTSLNVEPGGKSSWLARDRRGFPAPRNRARRAWRSTLGSCEARGFGSYEGLATIARTSPVRGSRATTPP